ncbi:N-isopropylammelide isopropylaminohydrolase [Serinicoccus chungangensis]|uniref:N-isopropylammelide isopropylaminohydrolase n=1 Tax=Serinicoccus chungangensis TaxID=767452 RepID=A0A0W8IEL9_9MICO|nr:amidohydrolase family protein [Serinicoccus chungangensis]KUG58383.1 N-isopropylammelide isopropylaminohydrolase [Serinicoccus chungangensis]
MWIRDVRPWGGPTSDVRLEGGLVAEVRPRDDEADRPAGARHPGAAGEEELEGRGRLLLPSFSDVHVHLDSTRLGLPFRPHTGGPGVWTMMLNDRAHWRDAEVGVVGRATHTLGLMIARGATRVRSFAQVDVDCGLERLEAVLAARETHRDRAEVQVIAFPQAGLLREEGSARVLEDALRAGADVVGGIDPCSLDRDPVRHLDLVFDLAQRYAVPVDIHLHEPGDLGRFSADLVCERTAALGMQGDVLISHGYGLWDGTESQTQGLVERLAELDIATATVAPGGRQTLPLARLAEAGVRVGLGQDGQRDYWSPYGNGDLLDRTWQLAFTHGFRADELVEHALAVATRGGASIMDRELPRLAGTADRPGLAPGDRADLVLVAGETPTSVVMDRPQDRTVLHRGRVVADGLTLT